MKIQKLREQYSSLPVLQHHPDVISHGKHKPKSYIKTFTKGNTKIISACSLAPDKDRYK